MSRDLDAVLAAIEGALADDTLPDAMRWSPEPDAVEDAGEPYSEDASPEFPLWLLGLADRPRFYVDPEWSARAAGGRRRVGRRPRRRPP